jgi:hypothetical protein
MTSRSRAGARGMTAAPLALGCGAGGRATGHGAAARQVPQPRKDNPDHCVTPLVPMNPPPLDRSLAEPAASGWRVVDVTLPGRAMHYRLVDEGGLAVRALDTSRARRPGARPP